MEHKLFTPEEANELLPQIRKELRSLQELAGKIESQHKDLLKFKAIHKHAFPDLPKDNDPFFEPESSLDFLRIEMDMMIRNFSRKGVLLARSDRFPGNDRRGTGAALLEGRGGAGRALPRVARRLRRAKRIVARQGSGGSQLAKCWKAQSRQIAPFLN